MERLCHPQKFLKVVLFSSTLEKYCALEKLKKLPKNEMIDKISSVLEVILEEEIDHVKKGDVWFNYACEKEGVESDIYFEIIDKYYPQGFLRPKNINIDGRKEAGFSCNELKRMAHKEVC